MKIETGEQLAAARQAAGITQAQLAVLLRLSPGSKNHISKVECGRAALYGPLAVACEYLLGNAAKGAKRKKLAAPEFTASKKPIHTQSKDDIPEKEIGTIDAQEIRTHLARARMKTR